MDFDAIISSVTEVFLHLGFKVVAAIVIWIVGRWLIKLATKMLDRGLVRQKIDPTITRYLNSALGVVLNIVLVVAILGFFGVETTSFAAVLAAAGIAIGMAWSGLLSNFAAGAFIIVLRPFKVGDFVTVGDVTGTVMEIGLFVTTLNTPTNVITFVGNGKVFSSNINNFSTNPYRRVDLVAQLNHSVDHMRAIAILKERLLTISNVLADPAPDVEILEFNLAGPVLAVRPYCNNAHYWQVYFDTNKAIREEFGKASFPVPEKHLHIVQK